MKFGNQGLWAGITSQGGTSNLGHTPYSVVFVNYCRYIYNRLKDEDRAYFSTYSALGFDLSDLYGQAREIYRETDEEH